MQIRGHRLPEVAPPHDDLAHPRPQHMRLDSAARGLDFGQLRHASRFEKFTATPDKLNIISTDFV
jgi:hypothetical protein